jgi:hypothetical protein
MSEIGSQSPSAFNESSYDDSSVFDRGDIYTCDHIQKKIAENIHYIHFSIQIVLISDKN